MVSFNQIPAAVRVPWVFVEFDNSQAVQGLTIAPWKALILGQKLSGGTATANTPYRVTSEAQADTLFGLGSMVSQMVASWRKVSKVIELWVIAQADNGSGTAATGKVTFDSAATATGVVSLYVGGSLVSLAVTAGDTAIAMTTNLVATIAADTSLPFTAAVDGVDTDTTVITYKHKGLVGNGIDLRLNYAGETLPVGVTATLTAFSGGLLNPLMADAIAAMGETRYNAIVSPYSDTASLTLLETELADRWGPVRQNDGQLFIASVGTQNDVATFGLTRNSPHVCCLGLVGIPTSSWQSVAAWASAVAASASIDPARPFQTLPVVGVLPPADLDKLDLLERNVLLFDGVSTFTVDANGGIRIERVITMYRKNGAGADDTSYLSAETVFTDSYLRYSFRTLMLQKFPRHKLANDGTRFAPGQPVLTPKTAKAEAIAWFRACEELGLVENADAFKEALIVERSSTDPNRLEFLLAPDLINQANVLAAQIAFRL